MDDNAGMSAMVLDVVAASLDEAGRDPKRLATAVATRLAAHPQARALGQGMVELMDYAESPWEPGCDAVDAEQHAVEASRRIVRPVLEAKLQEQLDVLDERSRRKVRCEHCGGPTCSQGRISRGWGSALGDLSLRRRYAYCATCGKGFHPAQKTIGLPAGEFTASLEEACTLMTTTVPFLMAKGLVAKLCGIEVSNKGLQSMTDRRGAEVVTRQQAEAEAMNPFEESGLPAAPQARPPDAVSESDTPGVAYLEIDGVIPITREEILPEELPPADRKKQEKALKQAKNDKARGGKAKRFRIVGREVKNAVLYDGKDCVSLSPGRGALLHKTYVSYLGHWRIFALWLWVAICRLRFDQAKQLVILSDGAEWIRSLAEWIPVRCLVILDLFHVKHRIWELAHSMYGAHSAKAAKWAYIQCQRIEDGHAEQVLQALRFARPQRADSKKLRNELIQYLQHNRDRIDYPAYRARGLRVTSGAVESANFHVTGTRLKLQGMRWSEDGARQMAALRADLFNGRHEARTREIIAA